MRPLRWRWSQKRPSAARSSKWAPLLLVAALGPTALPRPAYACKYASNLVSGGYIVSARAQAYPPIPRNAAFLWSSVNGEEPPVDAFAVAVDTATQSPIMGRVVKPIYSASDTSVWSLPATFMAKTDELVPPGLVLSALGEQFPPVYTTGDYVDEKPPGGPEIVDGGLEHE